MREPVSEVYRNVKITLDEKANRWGYCANRQRWTSSSITDARRKIDSLLDSEPQHNGANTNLYCDGRLFFVTGCPACDLAYEKHMKPRWERAKKLASELTTSGMSEVYYHADLWKIWAEGLFNGRKVRVDEQHATEYA